VIGQRRQCRLLHGARHVAIRSSPVT
jgi:hypothetical protein